MNPPAYYEVDSLFAIKAVFDENTYYPDTAVVFLPTGNVVFHSECKNWYSVRHLVRQVIKRLSSPPSRPRKGLVNSIVDAVKREEYLLETGFYPGQ